MRWLYIGFTLFMLIFGGAFLYFFKIGLEDHLAGQSITSVPLTVPEGLQMAEYQQTDGEALTEVSYDPEGAGYVHDILNRFNAAALGENDGFARTFSKGDERVAMRVAIAPRVKPAGNNPLTMLAQLGAQAAVPPPEPVLFGTLGGAPVFWHPAPGPDAGEKPVNFRRFMTRVGDQETDETLEIEAIAYASDQMVADILSGLDLAGMNDKLSRPWPDVPAAVTFVPAGDAPLSDILPPASTAYQAYTLLQQSADLSATDREVLAMLLDGSISEFADLAPREVATAELTAPVVAIFASDQADVSVRVTAATMLESDTEWSPLEAYILSQIALAGTTEGDLAEYLGDDREVSEAIRSLAAQLPE